MNYAPLMLYIVITCITPGPNNIMCMYLGAHCGLRGARKFMTASIAMFFIKMLLCGILNVALADVLPEIVPYLKWLGAAYMLYLAIHILMDGFRKKQDNVDEAVQTGESGYKRGVLLQVLNVKSWMGGLSVFSIYVVPYTTEFVTILLVACINLACMIAASLIWCSFGRAVRKVYSEHIKVFSVIMAALLLWCAYTALI